MKHRYFIKIAPYFLIFFALFLLALAKANLLDNDLGWHLRLGQEIVLNKALVGNLIGYNNFSDVSLVDHEWLFDALLYLGYNNLGWLALTIFFWCISGLSFALIYLSCLQKGANRFAALTAILIAFLPFAVVYGVRAQILLFLGISSFYLINVSQKSFYARSFLYSLVFVIGNNLHGGFLTLLPIPVLLELDISHSEPLFNKRFFTKRKRILLLALMLVGSFCLNPNLHGYGKVLIDMVQNKNYLNHISEWRSVFSLPIYWVNVILVLGATLFLFTVNNYWKRLKLNELVLCSIYLIIGLRSVRYFPIFAFLLIPFLSLAIEDTYLRLNLEQKHRALVTVIIWFGIIFSLIPKLEIPKKDIFKNPSYPSGALQYLAQSPTDKKGNLLNNYNWGGYQVWMYPNLQVFIDGRGPQTSVREKSSLLDEYLTFFSKNPSTIRHQLEYYDINSVIVSKESVRLSALDKWVAKIIPYKKFNQGNNLDNFLNKSTEWSPVYEDNIASVYYKK